MLRRGLGWAPVQRDAVSRQPFNGPRPRCPCRSRSLGEGAPYIDAWILDKRLSRIPGKPVSDKPFATLVGTRGNIRRAPGLACWEPRLPGAVQLRGGYALRSSGACAWSDCAAPPCPGRSPSLTAAAPAARTDA
jgi:hypothetical protein